MKLAKPINYTPALIMSGVAILAMLMIGKQVDGGSAPWLVLHVCMLFSIVYYAIANVFSESWGRSTLWSFAYFILMLVVLYFAADATAVAKMRDLPQYQKFLVLLIIFKVLLTGLAGLYRFFLDTLKNNA